jgi:hypothetical protein
MATTREDDMRNLRRGLLTALAVGLMLSVGVARFGRSSSVKQAATTNTGVCAAIDGNFDYLESITKSASLNILYESREAAALAANNCPDDTRDAGDASDPPPPTTTTILK